MRPDTLLCCFDFMRILLSNGKNDVVARVERAPDGFNRFMVGQRINDCLPFWRTDSVLRCGALFCLGS
jgi:hypothetical protein